MRCSHARTTFVAIIALDMTCSHWKGRKNTDARCSDFNLSVSLRKRCYIFVGINSRNCHNGVIRGRVDQFAVSIVTSCSNNQDIRLEQICKGTFLGTVRPSVAEAHTNDVGSTSFAPVGSIDQA
jgi:hypothetical protein